MNNTKKIVNKAISKAFDEKYSSYDYSNDARSINKKWKEQFILICNNALFDNYEDKVILDVGVGGGNEAIELFSKCKNITFVDIAETGLKRIKKKIPQSTVMVSKAEDLSALLDNTFDLYISLRTYNSSFFDINKAISEAHRVLRNYAKIIISIANGFLIPNKKIILPGLIIPGTDFVNIYRSIDMAKKLSNELHKQDFKKIQVFLTNEEIYVTAQIDKKFINNI